MAKVKLNLSLDADIKEALEQYAKEQHTTVSAVITAYALNLSTFKQIQQKEIKKEM